MTRRPSQPHPHPGLVTALAIVRLVMQLVEAMFAHIGDLPENHPDRRRHALLCRELQRAEARILANIAARQDERDCASAPAPAVRRGRLHRPPQHRIQNPRRAAAGPHHKPAALPRPGRGPPRQAPAIGKDNARRQRLAAYRHVLNQCSLIRG
ncbi:MAG: hypothetical protein NT133_05160 [Alphaproteobacteria bacterium]|nr:hypothetical protein [Alphaproteobacteria bacterium]